MTKKTLLKIIELKYKLMEAEKKHTKEINEAIKEGSYRFAEGYVSSSMEIIEEIEKELFDLDIELTTL